MFERSDSSGFPLDQSVDDDLGEGVLDSMLSDETEFLDVLPRERSDGFPHGEGNVRPVECLTGSFCGSEGRNKTVTWRVFIVVPSLVSPRRGIWNSEYSAKWLLEEDLSLDNVLLLQGIWQNNQVDNQIDEYRKLTNPVNACSPIGFLPCGPFEPSYLATCEGRSLHKVRGPTGLLVVTNAETDCRQSLQIDRIDGVWVAAALQLLREPASFGDSARPVGVAGRLQEGSVEGGRRCDEAD